MKTSRNTMKELHTLGDNVLDENLDLTPKAERRWAPGERRHWCVEAEKRRADLLRSELSGVLISRYSAGGIADSLEQGLVNGKIPENLASPLYLRQERACLFDSFFGLITTGQHKIVRFCLTDSHWYLPNHLWNGFWLKPAHYFRQSIRRKLHAAGFLGDNGFLPANLTGSLLINEIAIRLELRGIISESKLKMVHALPQRLRECFRISESHIALTPRKQYQLCQWVIPIRIQEDGRNNDRGIDPVSLWKYRRFCEAIFLLWLGNNRFEHMLLSDGLEIRNGQFQLTDGASSSYAEYR